MSLQQDGAALDEPGRWREVQGLLWGGGGGRSGLSPRHTCAAAPPGGRAPLEAQGWS